jgi:hypothetical protein
MRVLFDGRILVEHFQAYVAGSRVLPPDPPNGTRAGGIHAEDVANARLPGGQMTKAMGWRRNPATGTLEWTEIPICAACQAKYPPSQFPPDVQASPGGPWGR